MGSMGKKLTYIQQLRAINDAVYNTQLTASERRFYKWISTQDRHKHLFPFFLRRRISNWDDVSLRINQKHKR